MEEEILGHVDSGESDMVTAFRETEEEAGFAKDDLRVFDDSKRVLQYDVNGKPKTVVYWLAELVDKEKPAKLSNEHRDFKWLGIEEARELSGYEDMMESLTYFDRYIAKNIVGA